MSNSGALYFRDLGSSSWEKASVITDVINTIDGGSMRTCFYTTTAGLVHSFDGSIATPLSFSILNYGGSSALDIASTWSGEPCITTVSGKIYRYSGTPGTWYQVGVSNTNVRIDGNLTQDIFFSRKDNNHYSISITTRCTPQCINNI